MPPRHPPNRVLLWSCFLPTALHVGQGPLPLCLCTPLLLALPSSPSAFTSSGTLTDPGVIWPLGSPGTPTQPHPTPPPVYYETP